MERNTIRVKVMAKFIFAMYYVFKISWIYVKQDNSNQAEEYMHNIHFLVTIQMFSVENIG